MKKSFIEKKKNNSINNEFSSEINWRDDYNKSDMNEKSNCCINEENWNNKEDSWNDNNKNKKEEENLFKIENNWNDKDNDNWNDKDDNGWNNVFNESKTELIICLPVYNILGFKIAGGTVTIFLIICELI